MKLEIENKKKTSSFDINQLLLTYILLTVNLFDAVWWAVLALPSEGMSLYKMLIGAACLASRSMQRH